MHIKESTEWPRVSVKEKRHGAQYEGTVYDQDLVVETPDGEELILFDMTPMTAADIHPGEMLQVIVSIAVPGNLKPANAVSSVRNVAFVESIDYSPPQNAWIGFRDELLRRRWCKLRTLAGHFLMAVSEIEAAFRNESPLGTGVSWEGGRLDLMAWKRIM